MNKPDSDDLMELARDLYAHCSYIDIAITERREKIVNAMSHLVPTNCLVLVPSVVDTVIEQETIAFKN